MKRVTGRDPDSSNPARLRLATRADIDALCVLRLALFRELGTAPAERDAEFLTVCRTAYEALFDESRVLAWLALADDGAVVGALSLLFHARIPTPSRFECGEGYVVGVYTAPEWRRRGIATALMDAALEECRRKGLARVRLHTSEMGRAVYAAHGFEPRNDAMERRL
jgi:GNAT superfamily N-acetyltransferase